MLGLIAIFFIGGGGPIIGIRTFLIAKNCPEIPLIPIWVVLARPRTIIPPYLTDLTFLNILLDPMFAFRFPLKYLCFAFLARWRLRDTDLSSLVPFGDLGLQRLGTTLEINNFLPVNEVMGVFPVKLTGPWI